VVAESRMFLESATILFVVPWILKGWLIGNRVVADMVLSGLRVNKVSYAEKK